MIRVYPSSKVKHAQMWLDLHKTNPHAYFHARWLKHADLSMDPTPENSKFLWLECVEDIKAADVLLFYTEEGEHYKGALVEVGMALAFGVKVIIVGEHPDHGTWKWHPGVLQVGTLDIALKFIERMTPRWEEEQNEKRRQRNMGMQFAKKS